MSWIIDVLIKNNKFKYYTTNNSNHSFLYNRTEFHNNGSFRFYTCTVCRQDGWVALYTMDHKVFPWFYFETETCEEYIIQKVLE